MLGLTTQEILSLAYQLAEQSSKFFGSMDLGDISYLGYGPVRAVIKALFDTFFSILKGVQEKYSLPQHRIFNVDETYMHYPNKKDTQTAGKKVAWVILAAREDPQQ